MYSCKVVADSIGPAGVRLTTLEITYPLMVHAEFLRHRVLSRSGDDVVVEDFSHSVASNRAIPTKRILSQVINDPALPVWWGKNQPGMSAREELAGWRLWAAKLVWSAARLVGVLAAWLLTKLGLHKQLANRRMSPDQWVTQLVTGTDWSNFFALRCHPDAQPEIRVIAEMMREAMAKNGPRRLEAGEWHLPLVDAGEFWTVFGGINAWAKDTADGDHKLCLVSAARCARASSVKHEERGAVKDEIAKAESHMRNRHFSVFEHQAQALPDARRCANLRGWLSFRSTIPNEADFGKIGGAT